MQKGIALMLCVCFCVLLALSGCTDAQEQGLRVVYAGGLESVEDTEESPAFSAGICAFSLELFQDLAKSREGNVFISPASISVALGMTYNGARSETASQMQKVLQLDGIDAQTVNEGFNRMAGRLGRADEKVTVQLSNALWANKEIKISDRFIEENKKYFGAMLANMDFSSPDTVQTINKWVKESTNGKITKILDGPIDIQTVLFIMNAIYFEGSWAKPFKAENTEQEVFHGLNGDTEVPMMHQNESFLYSKVDGGQMVFLPYGNGELGMYVLLPGEGVPVRNTIANLDADVWQKWTQKLTEARGSIGLPRFKLEYETYLKDVLSRMGMGNAFSDTKADFSGIAEAVSIKDIRHKAYIDVDEKGTRAAAVTSVEMRTTAVQESQEPFEMTMDRPFLFAIADRETGAILFMGSVVDP